MKKARDIYFYILLSALIFLSSCASMAPIRSSGDPSTAPVEKPLGVAATLRFEDVPIPAGFNILRDQSFIYQDNALRVGLVRYTGRANASQATSFFKTQMPLYNWDLINVVEYGAITMNFVKSNENCVVTVEPFATKTIISVVISPKSGTVSTGLGLRKSDRF